MSNHKPSRPQSAQQVPLGLYRNALDPGGPSPNRNGQAPEFQPPSSTVTASSQRPIDAGSSLSPVERRPRSERFQESTPSSAEDHSARPHRSQRHSEGTRGSLRQGSSSHAEFWIDTQGRRTGDELSEARSNNTPQHGGTISSRSPSAPETKSQSPAAESTQHISGAAVGGSEAVDEAAVDSPSPREPGPLPWQERLMEEGGDSNVEVGEEESEEPEQRASVRRRRIEEFTARRAELQGRTHELIQQQLATQQELEALDRQDRILERSVASLHEGIHQRYSSEHYRRRKGKHMSKGYRAAVKDAYQTKPASQSDREFAENWDIAPSTLTRMKKEIQEESVPGYSEQREVATRAPDFSYEHIQSALRAIEVDCQLTLEEISSRIEQDTGDKFQKSTISKHLKRIGLVSKAAVHFSPSWNSPRIIGERHAVVDKFQALVDHHLVFIDESAFNTAQRKRTGRAERGHSRPYIFVPDTRGDNRTLVAALYYPPRELLTEEEGRRAEGTPPAKVLPFWLYPHGSPHQKRHRKRSVPPPEAPGQSPSVREENDAASSDTSGPQEQGNDEPIAPPGSGLRSKHLLAYIKMILSSLAHLGDNRPITIVWDNAPIHKALEIKRYIEEQPGVHLLYLPPYSPFLDPVEYLFARVKRSVRRRKVMTESELKQTIEEAMTEANNSRTVEGFWRRSKSYHKLCFKRLALTGSCLHPKAAERIASMIEQGGGDRGSADQLLDVREGERPHRQDTNEEEDNAEVAPIEGEEKAQDEADNAQSPEPDSDCAEWELEVHDNTPQPLQQFSLPQRDESARSKRQRVMRRRDADG